jgi:hypothetical protein
MSSDETAKLRFIDVHAHHHPQHGPRADELLRAMDEAGISRMVVFTAFSAGARLAGGNSGRFVMSYQGPIALSPIRQKLLSGPSSGLVKKLLAGYEAVLASGEFKGLGEIPTHHRARPEVISPDSAIIRGLLELAVRRNVPVNIHCSSPESSPAMDRALSSYPTAIVIWAHGGSYLSATAIRELLQRHSNLHFDLSTLHPPWPLIGDRTHIGYGGVIDESWRLLFESYPSRFLMAADFGLGTSGPTAAPRTTPLSAARAVGDFFRRMLPQLPPEVARMLAHENAERVYKLG